MSGLTGNEWNAIADEGWHERARSAMSEPDRSPVMSVECDRRRGLA